MKQTLVFLFFAPCTALFAQGAPLDPVQPVDIVGDAAIMAVLAAVTTLISYFSKVLPFLGRIPEIKVRAGVSAGALILGVAYFKGGFFGSDTLPFVTGTLLLVLAAFGVGGSSGWIYDLLKKLLGDKGFKSVGQ